MKSNIVSIVLFICLSHVSFSTLISMELAPPPYPRKSVHHQQERTIVIFRSMPRNKHTKPFNSRRICRYLTQQICAVNNYQALPTRKNIGILSQVNKWFNRYYACQTTRKQIVRTCALGSGCSDLSVAKACGYEKITNIMKTMFHRARNNKKQFCPGDMKDSWYLSATEPGSTKTCFSQLSVLHLAAAAGNVEKTKMLIEAGCIKKCDRCPSPIALLAGPNREFHDYGLLSLEAQKNHFAILELLLQAKVDPDDRCGVTSFTYLQRAVENGDQERARLLLRYGANPYKLFFDDCYKQNKYYDLVDKQTGKTVKWSHPAFNKFMEEAKKLSTDVLYLKENNSREPWKHNAFTLERGDPKGWLMTMYDETQKEMIKKS